jgi:hypothetical protein
MNKQRFTLDSNIIIGHLNNEFDLFTFFETQPEYEICLSVIASIETLAKPELTTEEEKKAKDFSVCITADHFRNALTPLPGPGNFATG